MLDLAWRPSCRRRRIGEAFEQPLYGGRAVFNRCAFIVVERNLREHAPQVAARFQELRLARPFGHVKIATRTCHPVRTLLENV